MMNRITLALAALLLVAAGPPQVVPPSVAPGAAVDSNMVGGRTLAARASDVIDVMDAPYGAKCDGATDDAAAINQAVSAFRTTLAAGKPARLVISRQCLIRSTINLTGIHSYLGVVDMRGGQLVCSTSGTPCVDAIDTAHITWLELTIQGTSANRPSYGLQTARLTATSDCAEQRFDNFKTLGLFTKASFYSGSCETMRYTSPHFQNDDTGNSYAVVLDGANHWGVTSAFVSVTNPTDAISSFNENVFLNATVVGRGSTSPLWIDGQSKHRWIGSYLLALGSPYGIVLYDTGAMPVTMLDFDTHVEGTAMTDTFFVSGSNATPIFYGFRYLDQKSQATNSYFKLDTNITSASMYDADLRMVNQPSTPITKLFDAPLLWTASGRIVVPSAAYSQTLGAWSGTLCTGVTCTVTFSLPGNLTAGSISNPGGVTSLNFTATGSFATVKPTCAVDAPPSGGQTAGCTVNSVNLAGYGTILSGGSGYTVNDILTYPGTCSVPPQIKVTAASGGVVTAYTNNGPQPVCAAPLPRPLTLTGGTGSGMQMTAIPWRVTASNVSFTAGAGYTTPPNFMFTSGESGTNPATAVGALSSVFTANAGGGQMLLNSTGTLLGIAGSAGYPVISSGALIDSSGVRVSLGSTYTVPANTSLVRLTQASTVAASTVTLPTALADGQPVQFVNYAGAVTALTFSPAVNGWTNGSTLAANTGLRVRWDATGAAWYREQ